jgi:hypothetical protein
VNQEGGEPSVSVQEAHSMIGQGSERVSLPNQCRVKFNGKLLLAKQSATPLLRAGGEIA